MSASGGRLATRAVFVPPPSATRPAAAPPPAVPPPTPGAPSSLPDERAAAQADTRHRGTVPIAGPATTAAEAQSGATTPDRLVDGTPTTEQPPPRAASRAELPLPLSEPPGAIPAGAAVAVTTPPPSRTARTPEPWELPAPPPAASVQPPREYLPDADDDRQRRRILQKAALRLRAGRVGGPG